MKPYDRGYVAAANKLTLAENPYIETSAAHVEWVSGFDQFMEDNTGIVKNETLDKYPQTEADIDLAISELQDLKKTYRHLCDVGCGMTRIAGVLKESGMKTIETFYADQKKELDANKVG